MVAGGKQLACNDWKSEESADDLLLSQLSYYIVAVVFFVALPPCYSAAWPIALVSTVAAGDADKRALCRSFSDYLAE